MTTTNRNRRNMFSIKVLLLGAAGLWTAMATAASSIPVPVSPGASKGAGIAIADSCPTFSWGQSQGAGSYELTVYRVEDEGLEADPLFTQKIDGTASSWTPSLARCLEPGGRYAWSVRAVSARGGSDWAEPSLFSVQASTKTPQGGSPEATSASAIAGDPVVSELSQLASTILPQAAVAAGHDLGNQNTTTGNNALVSLTTGTKNTADGAFALEKTTSGNNNTGTGASALRNNTAGSSNTAVGALSLPENTTGYSNTAVGSLALRMNTTGKRNTSTGVNSMSDNTTGQYNTATGNSALRKNETGGGNTASGFNSLSENVSGSRNSALGAGALRNLTMGFGNTALGDRAGTNLTSGSDNLFIANQGLPAESQVIRIGTQGKQLSTFLAGIFGTPLAGSPVVVTSAGQLGTTAGGAGSGLDADKVDGFHASGTATAGTLLALDGMGQLPASITGNAATATLATAATALAADGTDCAADEAAGGVDASGNSELCRDQADLTAFEFGNTRVGSGALAANTTGFINTAVGSNALRVNTTGFNNTAVGYSALSFNTTGFRNTAVGYAALSYNTEGQENTAVGLGALRFNTTGSLNTALGRQALYKNTTGRGNTASGLLALRDNTTGYRNTATGYGALPFNTTGGKNTATGSVSLVHNTTGSENTATGYGALEATTTGSNNTAAGAFSLHDNTTGHNNTAIGRNAGEFATTGSNNIFIANQGVAGDDKKIKIGTEGIQTMTYAAGIRGVTTGVADAIAVVIDSSGQLGTVSSSRRYKEEIADMGDASDGLLALRPVTFRYKKEYADGGKPIQFGLIAEEVAEVFPELVVYNEDGVPETVKYHLLSSLLLNEVQQQALENEQQALEIERLRSQVAKQAGLEQRVRELETLEARLARLESVLPAEPRRFAVTSGLPSDKGGAP